MSHLAPRKLGIWGTVTFSVLSAKEMNPLHSLNLIKQQCLEFLNPPQGNGSNLEHVQWMWVPSWKWCWLTSLFHLFFPTNIRERKCFELILKISFFKKAKVFNYLSIISSTCAMLHGNEKLQVAFFFWFFIAKTPKPTWVYSSIIPAIPK